MQTTPAHQSSQKPIGLFGGTYDPVHLGHLSIASTLHNKLTLQEVRLIPCRQNVLKINTPEAPAADRLAMLQHAIQGHHGLVIDDRELQRNSASYMIDTIESIQTEIDNPIYLIMSSDTFASFDQWHRWQAILKLVNLVLTPRPGFKSVLNQTLTKLLSERQTNNPSRLLEHRSGCILLQTLDITYPISATKIRAIIKADGNPSEWLNPTVWKYICENHLYR